MLHFRWTPPSQAPPRVVVHPGLYFGHLPPCDSVEIRPFREEPPDDAVAVFVGALLPGGVTVAVKDLESLSAVYGLYQLLMLQKLRPVVRGDAPELLPECLLAHAPLHPVKCLPDRTCPPVWQLADDLFLFEPLCQRQQHWPAPGPACDQIHLPVSRFLSPVDLLRPLFNAGQFWMRYFRLLLLPGLPAGLFQQIGVRQLVKYSAADVAVQCPHAD